MVGGLCEKGEGIKKYKLVVTKQSRGCKVQHRDIVSNVVISMCGARWVLDLLGESLHKLYKRILPFLNSVSKMYVSLVGVCSGK